jgi:hypothetical protein
LRKLTVGNPDSLLSPSLLFPSRTNATTDTVIRAVPVKITALGVELDRAGTAGELEGDTAITTLGDDDVLDFDSVVSVFGHGSVASPSEARVNLAAPVLTHDTLLPELARTPPAAPFPAPADDTPTLPIAVVYPRSACPRDITHTVTSLLDRAPNTDRRAAEAAMKKQQQQHDRDHNKQVAQRRTESALNLGGSVIITPGPARQATRARTDVQGRKRKPPTTVTKKPPKKRCNGPGQQPPVTPPLSTIATACRHGSAWFDLAQLGHVSFYLKPKGYLDGKHCQKCRTPLKDVAGKRQPIYYCLQDFNAFELDPTQSGPPCDCVVCAPCRQVAIDAAGPTRRRRCNPN